jgi:hypothetical protein
LKTLKGDDRNNKAIIMKRLRARMIILSLFLIFIPSCSLGNNQDEKINGGAVFITQASTNAFATLTQSETIRSTATPSLTPTVNIHSTATPVAVSTLPPDEAETSLNELLDSNGGCRLPCFWGIRAGVTDDQEARKVLEPLGGISDLNYFQLDNLTISPRLSVDDITIHFGITTLLKNEVVDTVYFFARPLITKETDEGPEAVFLFNSVPFGEKLSSYMLPSLLSELGVPENVMISTMGEYPDHRYGQGHFKMIILYPDKGVMAMYTTEMEIVGKDVRGCLANNPVELYLFSPGNRTAFFEALSERSINWSQFLSIEEAASITLDDFYTAFSQRIDECIFTPASMWPIPER